VEICTVSPDCIEYATEVKKEIEKNGFFVETNFSDDTLDKRIRNAQLEQFSYILVIGKREKASQTVNVRTRDNVVHGTKKIAELLLDWNQKLANHE
jgi:threonyl-tRNA synthetase